MRTAFSHLCFIHSESPLRLYNILYVCSWSFHLTKQRHCHTYIFCTVSLLCLQILPTLDQKPSVKNYVCAEHVQTFFFFFLAKQYGIATIYLAPTL